MATEAQIRGAERARLEQLFDEFGTEGERLQLRLSALMRNGFTVAQYLGEEPLGHLAPEPELLARLARRVERREKAGLQAVACAGEPPTRACTCLEFALDAAGGGSRRAILRRAGSLHWSPPPRRERAEPVEASSPSPVAQEANEGAREAALPRPPKPELIPAHEQRPRFYRRASKWYDPTPNSFRDMRF
jgi:hypothetical protein